MNSIPFSPPCLSPTSTYSTSLLRNTMSNIVSDILRTSTPVSVCWLLEQSYANLELWRYISLYKSYLVLRINLSRFLQGWKMLNSALFINGFLCHFFYFVLHPINEQIEFRLFILTSCKHYVQLQK